MTRAPFRAEHVGSLLRTPALLAAREKFQQEAIDAATLRAAEDAAIAEGVKLQEDAGLPSITDGEYRRTFFHTDFLQQLGGVEIQGGLAIRFHRKDGDLEFAPPRLEVKGRLEHVRDIQRADFEYLRSLTERTPKVCIPSPTMVHFRGGRSAIDEHAYPDLDAFFEDLAACYRAEVTSLAEAGCRYLQLDDTNLAYLCDPKFRQGCAERGDDPEQLPHLYADLINRSIASRPDDMVVGIHLCRGNFQSAWVAEGDYEPVAEAMFNEIGVDAFFLEYDDERSGSFQPLRHVPKNKKVVLGLITTKEGSLESADDLVRRIDEAAKHIDPDQLCLSPQCGFSSTVHGNDITQDQEIAKLRLVVEVAERVWGSAA